MTVVAQAFDDCSLRERKRARLRVGLWSALRERIETTPYANITTRELSAAVEVSEPTFFTHFPAKSDLISYHICMWRIATALAAAPGGDGIGFLRRFFDHTAESIVAGPQMWFEITAEVARSGGLCAVIDITPAERLLVFRDPAALSVEITPQAALFARHLAVAAAEGQLVGTVDDAVTGLMAGFYGVPLALGHDRLTEIAAGYRAQLGRFVVPEDRR